jgi:programmed cell death protein 5
VDGQSEQTQTTAQEQNKKAQQEVMIRRMLGQILQPQAYERLMMVKAQNTQTYQIVVQTIVSLAQRGRIQDKINEQQLRDIIMKIYAQRPQPKIEFRRKGE